MSSTPVHVYQAYIDAEPERVWNALVDGDQTVKYFYGTRIQSDLQLGSPVVYTDHSGGVVADGEVLVCDPPRRFEHTFQARWDPELVAEGPVREAWILEEVNGATRLTVEVYDIAADSKTIADFREGFPYIVSGLKTLVETGRSLPMPG